MDVSLIDDKLAGGVILSLITILMGFTLGLVFGVLESGFKPWMRAKGEKVLDTVYGGDAAKLESVVSKGWKYAIRGHLHGGAIGTASLVSILVMSMSSGPGGAGTLEALSAWAFGAGGLIYSSFWVLAGFRAPAVGDGKKAKEDLRLIAQPGAGLCFLGLLGTIVSFISSL